jgi:site-specific DNA-methyltransferase (adenine-specific)
VTPYYQDDWVTIYHGDALEFTPDLAVDVAITDPPYNAGKAYGVHDDAMPDAEFRAWLGRRFAAIDADSLVYFPGTRNIWSVPAVLGDWRFKRMLGWHKREYAGDLWSGGPAMCWEPIIWALRGGVEARFNRVFGWQGRDFLAVDSVHGNPMSAVHPCPKPLPVMAWLVGLFALPGDVVLDPFAGTGTTLLAAKTLGHKVIGIEIEERYCEIAAKRCAQEVFDFPHPIPPPGEENR